MADNGLKFDLVASKYNRFRMGYDPRLVSDLLRVASLTRDSRACEIGAGTGQASQQFAAEGIELVCVEPGAAMAALLSENLRDYPKARCVVSTFEEAALPPSHFDLVFAAQSLHWVDSGVRYTRPCELLKPEGVFAAFWKRTEPKFWHDCPLLAEILSQHLSDFRVQSYPEFESEASSWLLELTSSGLFRFCELRRYRSLPTPFSESHFLGSIESSSSVICMTETARESLRRHLLSYFKEYPTEGMLRRFETVLVFGYKSDADTS